MDDNNRISMAEVAEAKKVMDNKIRESINEFYKATKLRVSGIELVTVKMSNQKEVLMRVKTLVEIM